jgi:UDP-N-acetylmuramoyl-tripeptide--D-alanyl-D-alanine ligase
MHTVGLASALNATAAIAVAWVLGLGSELAKQALATYQPPTGSGYARMRVQRIGALTILNDSYNANPESMALSLRTLQLYRATRRIAVLGDMRELGKGARVEHEKVLSQAMSVADIVMLFGPEFESLVGDAGLVFTSHQEIAERLNAIAQDGDVVLLKGSRGLAMEKVLEGLMQRTA